jgi:HSP20 family molecular chaperone IbpA
MATAGNGMAGRTYLGTGHAIHVHAMDEAIDHKSPRSRFTVERVLLAAVLILQVGILLLLTSRSPSPAQPGPGNPVARPDSHASRRNLSDGESNRPKPAQSPVGTGARFLPAESARRMMAEMDRVFERTVGDLDEVGRAISLDDGWDRLVAMPAFDVRDRGSAYHVRFSLPDGNPHGTELTLEGRVLTIGFTSPAHRRSAAMSVQYSRQIMLPGPVADGSDARAFVTNGLLYVIVPKDAAAGPGHGVVQRVRVF